MYIHTVIVMVGSGGLRELLIEDGVVVTGLNPMLAMPSVLNRLVRPPTSPSVEPL